MSETSYFIGIWAEIYTFPSPTLITSPSTLIHSLFVFFPWHTYVCYLDFVLSSEAWGYLWRIVGLLIIVNMWSRDYPLAAFSVHFPNPHTLLLQKTEGNGRAFAEFLSVFKYKCFLGFPMLVLSMWNLSWLTYEPIRQTLKVIEGKNQSN